MLLSERLQRQAMLLKNIRNFFEQRGVTEVSTSLLALSTIPDPAIESFHLSHQDRTHYLQTSPEFQMKRLLAAGSGCIYQLGKAFRKEENGRYHHHEFTLLEWYRVGFDHLKLMSEVDLLLQTILGTAPLKKITYQALFEDILKVNPHTSAIEQLRSIANEKTNATVDATWTFDQVLDLLFCECIEPFLTEYSEPVAVYEFPASKAALARLIPSSDKNKAPVAARFECYVQGIELANGFYELNDPILQRQRFVKDNETRKKQHQAAVPLDETFLSVLADLPDCSGVALGIDRLMMLAFKIKTIKDLIYF